MDTKETKESIPERPSRDKERIYTSIPVEVRAGRGNGRIIGGHALVFNKLSQNLGGYVERIMPSFPNKSRADGWPGVVCRYNHKDDFLLGTTQSGTLVLSLDEMGMVYDVDVPQCREDVLEMVARRDIAHSSFAFQIYEQEWGVTEDQNYPQRTLISGRIIDVAPVSTPAYRDTNVALRSLADQVQASIEDVQKLADADELRKLLIRTDGPKVDPLKPPMSARLARMRLLAKRPDDPIG